MKPSVVAFGDNVVDCYTDERLMYPGGNTLNLSVFFQRFGGCGAYIGAVGNDVAGRHIRASLLEEGVNLSGFRIEAGATAFCLIGLHNGDREFRGADLGVSIITPNNRDLDQIAGADAVHTGRSSHVDDFLQDFSSRTRLSFDFAVIRDRKRIAQIAPLCFLASFSGGDLSDSEVEDLLNFAVTSGAKHVLITRGGKGASFASKDLRVDQLAIPVEPVDTLGAGDTFIARTLLGLLREEEPTESLAVAAAEAAKTCVHAGGFGHPAALAVDESKARSLAEIYGPGEAVRA